MKAQLCIFNPVLFAHVRVCACVSICVCASCLFPFFPSPSPFHLPPSLQDPGLVEAKNALDSNSCRSAPFRRSPRLTI
ncbi:hypothetical protein GGR50DRAFT_639529 [Xylaria sp. CBS 124048]|nr:hypothetical protein GGR50DRAFT_639529 [Xylaria sp. CBS 124048]